MFKSWSSSYSYSSDGNNEKKTYETSYKDNKKDLKAGEKLDGEGGFCARGRLTTSKHSKENKILPLGLTDGALVKKDIKKDQIITLNDVELNLPKEVIEAREYQYKLV